MLTGNFPDRILHILHVEDDAAVRDVTRRILENVGHTVYSVADATAALSLLSLNVVDIVVMDRGLQGIDGVEATRRIRSRTDAMRDVPVIGLTASNDDAEIRACRAAGMNEVLIKPVSAAILRAAVIKFASGGSNADDRPTADTINRPSADDRAVVVDLQKIADILGEDAPAELRSHLEFFVGHFPDSIERIEIAAQEGTCAAVAGPLHAAKGAAATAAAMQLYALLQEAEKTARSGAWPAVSSLIAKIRPEFERVRAFLENFEGGA